jgi:DNA-binding CsgD family transcriptional regulator
MEHRSDPPRFLDAPAKIGGQRDYVSVIEAAYSKDADWIPQLMSSIYPVLNEGCGVVSWRFEIERTPEGRERLHVFSPVFMGCPVELFDALGRAATRTDEHTMRLFYRSAPGISITQILGGREKAMSHGGLQELAPVGVHDQLLLQCSNLDHKGFVVAAPMPIAKNIHPRRTRALARLAVHIAAANRLRHNAVDRGDVDTDAVLSPAGKVLHAEGNAKDQSARHELQRAVLDMELGRGALRKNEPERAVQLWRALVAGRWSLIESVDTDGRRFLLARRNAPSIADPKALGIEERRVAGHAALGHSTKLTAYALGIASSTVTERLATAMRKLGVGSRAELIGLFHHGSGEADE